jgi:TolB-like protein
MRRDESILSWKPMALRAMALWLLCAAGGCQYVGAVLGKVTEDPKTPAEYVPTRETMLILIENYRNPDSVAIVSDRLMSDVATQLKANKVDQLIDPKTLFEFRSAHADIYPQLKIPELAKMLGARQVLYGDLVQFDWNSAIASNMIKGQAKLIVKIIDAQTGETRWPQDSSPGEIVTVETPTVPVTADADATEQGLKDTLVNRLSQRVAELFYEHPEEPEDNPEAMDQPTAP